MDTGNTLPTSVASQDAHSQRRYSRWWVSWQVWMSGLVVATAAVLVLCAIPFVRRAQALQYFDDNGVIYHFWEDDDWITDRFGEWAKPLRSISYIGVDIPSRRTLMHVARFPELNELGIDVPSITWDTVTALKEVPQVEILLYCCDFYIDDESLRRVVDESWTLQCECDCDPIPDDW